MIEGAMLHKLPVVEQLLGYARLLSKHGRTLSAEGAQSGLHQLSAPTTSGTVVF